MSTQTHHSGKIVDIFNERIFLGTIEVRYGKIQSIVEDETVTETSFLCPGFIDAHRGATRHDGNRLGPARDRQCPRN